MTTTPDTDSHHVRTFLRVLGGELRKARMQQGLTRKQLVHDVPFTISVPTLATWELATRHITVGRLLELTDALGVHLFDVLGPALAAVAADTVTVDLARMASTHIPALQPLRRWARQRLLTDPPELTRRIIITPGALPWLATVCDSPIPAITHHLRQFTAT
jgi:transcriptional regulator with XRE-family HTH domain